MSLLIDRLDLKTLHQMALAPELINERWLEVCAKVFEISNVADLTGRIPDLTWKEEDKYGQHEFGIYFDKFPNVAPPYDRYWMEWKVPDKQQIDTFPIHRVGVWFEMLASTDDDTWYLGLAIFGVRGKGKPFLFGAGELEIDHETGEAREHIPLGLAGGAWDLIDPKKPPMRDDEIPPEWREEANEIRADIEAKTSDPVTRRVLLEEELLRYDAISEDRVRDGFRVWSNYLRVMTLPTVLQAHSLMACKNVEHDTHPRPPKVTRARKKKGKAGVVTFKTLKIRPARGQRTTSETMSVGDGQRALHIVRGHFKTFTAERPLLGKHVGTYYWAPALRGNEEEGIIVKDYEL